MNILDNFLDKQGRLFGKISILDLGAILIIMGVIIGIFVFPGATGSVAQVQSNNKTIEVDVIALGLKGMNLPALFKNGDKINLIVRNQPYGQVTLKSSQILPRTVLVPQPNGSVKALPDPREEESFSKNMLFTLEGKGQLTKDGPVFGNVKMKIGNTVELDGFNYNFNASVIDVRVSK